MGSRSISRRKEEEQGEEDEEVRDEVGGWGDMGFDGDGNVL